MGKAESQRVAKQFAADQSERRKVIQKASIEAGKQIDDKMAKEDAELLAPDKETDVSVQNILGSQKQLEDEQALYAGTMTPAQVNAAVDPDMAKLETKDLFDENAFAAVQPLVEKNP